MLRFVAQKVQKSRRRAMIVCLATRIFEGRRGWGRLHPAACWRQWPLRHSAPDKSYSLCGRISRVPFNPDMPLPAFAPDHATASPNYQGSITIFASPIAAALGVRRAYRSGVSVFEDDIADQRSSKLAAGRSFASTMRPFDIVVPAETTVPSRRVRPHGRGGCGNSEQSDSREPGNRSMPRHQNLLWSRTPLSYRSPELCEGSTAIRQVWMRKSRQRS